MGFHGVEDNRRETAQLPLTPRSEEEINQLLAPVAAEYADEERAAAEQESHGIAVPGLPQGTKLGDGTGSEGVELEC
jgi:hypothetical protein